MHHLCKVHKTDKILQISATIADDSMSAAVCRELCACALITAVPAVFCRSICREHVHLIRAVCTVSLGRITMSCDVLSLQPFAAVFLAGDRCVQCR